MVIVRLFACCAKGQELKRQSHHNDFKNLLSPFYAPESNDPNRMIGGILFLSCLFVCLFVCLSVCLSVVNFNLRCNF